jgi:hypothetical protein
MKSSAKNSLVHALKRIATIPCEELANNIENISSKTLSFHLREASLDTDSIKILNKAFRDFNSTNDIRISSLSLSYNPQIGDEGILDLLKNIPFGLTELGLVGCNLTDESGRVLLNWLKDNEYIRLLCIENNLFSKELKLEFKTHANNTKRLYLAI